MSKTIAMIPVRLGSKRVKNKNLRLIDGKPLISYVLETAIKANVFDEIYINSESEIFEPIAKKYGVKFYKRPDYLAEDDKTNDDFAYDFLQNIECDDLVQLLSTSPFMSVDDVTSFVNTFKNNNYETLISVKNVQIESIYDGTPINFNQKEITPPSQDLKPIQSYACGLMAWNKNRYMENMNKYNSAYHGGDGRTGFFELSGYATIDIDTEDDFRLAEVIHNHLSTDGRPEPQYYGGERGLMKKDDNQVNIAKEDGIGELATWEVYTKYQNRTTIGLDTLRKELGMGSWAARVSHNDAFQGVFLQQHPGEGNRKHYHPDAWENWIIIDGEWEWWIEGEGTKKVKTGDSVIVPQGTWHKITCVGDSPGVRYAMTKPDVVHIFEEDKKE